MQVPVNSHHHHEADDICHGDDATESSYPADERDDHYERAEYDIQRLSIYKFISEPILLYSVIYFELNNNDGLRDTFRKLALSDKCFYRSIFYAKTQKLRGSPLFS